MLPPTNTPSTAIKYEPKTAKSSLVKGYYMVNFLQYMTLTNLTSNQLLQAANIKDQIEALNKQLNALLGGSAAMPVPNGLKKGGMSAAGKARIAAAQRARWAKVNAAKVPANVMKPAMKKPKMSAAGRARIVAAQKARWAKIKAAKKA